MSRNAEITKLAFAFLKADEETQKMAIAIFDDEQKQAFLTMVSFLRIIADRDYHDKIKEIVLETYLRENNITFTF